MSRLLDRAPRLLAASLFVLTVAALVRAATTETFVFAVGDVGLRFTVTASILAAVIVGLGFVVLTFTARYAIDDPRRVRLQWLMLGAIAAAASVAAAATLVGLLVAWLLTSAFLVGLLAHRGRQVGGGHGLGRALISIAVADAMFAAALVTAVVVAGNAPTDSLGAVAADLGRSSVLGIDAATLTALLLVGAALGRCAQIPFGPWLTRTLETPTPVSALMHAGIVNAGGILLVITAPIVFASEASAWLLFSVASASMLYATSLMTARPDVKGGLALSTRGQMAFMLLQCAMGAFAAALFHLIAHGMYKAYLFLGSGGAIAERRRLETSPHSPLPGATGTRARRQAAVALIAPAALLAATVLLVAPGVADDSSGIVLLLFAYATGAQATWWWLRLRGPDGTARMLGLGALAASTVAYVLLLDSAKGIFAPDMPATSGALVPALALVPIFAVAASVTALRWISAARGGRPARDSLRNLNRRAYAAALRRGSLSPGRGGGSPSRLAATPPHRFVDETAMEAS